MTALDDLARLARHRGEPVVQPRMGFARPARMRAGLARTRAARALTAGTITVDSYTRVGDLAGVREALAAGAELNGFPLVAHGPGVTRAVVAGIGEAGFPVQVRHGSAMPLPIVATLLAAGLDATEGGPVSYCLPYGRTPLRESVAQWARCCELLAAHGGHLESFGGCLLGQLCPPGLLVAVSVLEGIFFRRHGLRAISLSYAQQADTAQDIEAIAALRALAAEMLPDVDPHIVLYTHMGAYPRSRDGARELLRESARLAVWAGAERLIVKTTAEAARIPTVEENVAALETAAVTARRHRGRPVPVPPQDTGVLAEARALVEAVLDLDGDLGRAFVRAFERGVLDVPYCLHPDNRNRARAAVDAGGRLRWVSVGAMPIRGITPTAPASAVDARSFLRMLSFVRDAYDRPPPTPDTPAHIRTHPSARDNDPDK
ncbi:methylaspartate mutase [Actinomadura roseirufa]|uniref:methylaspartate mutase n=1 Tax=Actinomadura roseirufa TaxID=2094049 RepID=UPI001F5EB71D|nr:methylaspartate mutase [Actinomadura roseirufa]